MNVNINLTLRDLRIIKLSEEELKQIYEKAIDKIMSEMIEISENSYEISMTQNELNKYITKHITARVYCKNPELIGARKEEIDSHVTYNKKRLNEMIQEEKEE